MNRAALAIALALVALAMLATGCGGGSSSNSNNDGSTEASSQGGAKGSNRSSSSPPSTQAFIKQADSICAEAKERIETEFKAFLKEKGIKELGEKGESPKEAAAHSIEAIEAVGIPQLQRQLRELKALEAPAEIEGKVTAYLDAVEEELEGGEKNPEALAGPAEKVFPKSDAAAKKVGFKVCGNH